MGMKLSSRTFYNFVHVCAVSPVSIYEYFDFQRYPTDRAYFIAKEILMTERTFKKDLEVINLVR
jgi:hypothetical protein